MSSGVTTPSPGNVIAASIVLSVLCTVAVALRFFARYVQRNKVLVDDWLTLPALILTIGLGVALIIGVTKKSLAYPTPLPPDPKRPLDASAYEIRVTRQITWAFMLLQIPALCLVKLSFIYFYRRVFCTGLTTIFKHITTVVIWIILAWGISFFFAFLFICEVNFAAFWTSIRALNTHCGGLLDLQLGFAISDFITDFFVLVLPLPMIWRIHMSTSRKLAVTIIICLGALAVAASATRMVIFSRAVVNLKRSYRSSGADNLTTTTGIYWSLIESGLALIACCLPSTYSLIKHMARPLHPLSRSSKSQISSTESAGQIISGGAGFVTIDSQIKADLGTSVMISMLL